jgi:hypothetical protein
MSRPTLNLKIREASALVVIIALGLALLVQCSAYLRTIMDLENEVKFAQHKNIFKKFMDMTFGELGVLIIREPQEMRLHVFSTDGKKLEFDRSSPIDIMSQMPAYKKIKLSEKYGRKFYNEFTPESVDDQFSYFDPAMVAALEFVRNGDSVLVFSGKENGLSYARVFVLDANKKRKNENYGWFKFGSTLMDEIMASAK